MSCVGCHETRSLAGFHLLGEERDHEREIDVLFVGTSPHLDGDVDRRREYTRAALEGRTPDDARPFADHERTPGSYGSHCGLGNRGLAGWTCGEGLACVDLREEDIGACLPAVPTGA